MTALAWLWFAAVSAILVGVAVTDWRRRLVANGSVVTLTVLAGLFVAVGEADAPAVSSRWWALVAAGAVFGMTVALYAAGLIAAGDAKLALPVALIMARLGPTAWLFYLMVFIIAALVVLAVFGRRGRSMPLAPVLGLGVIPALLAAPPPWFSP